MQLGDRGDKVVEVQEYLRSLGFLDKEEDGFRLETKRAVIRYQNYLGLEPTGIWDDSIVVLEDYYRVSRMRARSSAKVSITKLDYKPINSSFVSNQALSGALSNSLKKQVENTANETVLKKGSRNFTVDEIPCYIYNLNTGKKIIFALESPESITDNMVANFDTQMPRGRSSPFQGYSGSGPRNLDFTLELSADYCPDGLVQTCNALRALCYPHNATVIVEPKCLFRLGVFLSVKAVPTSVSIEWKKPYKDGIYSLASVSIALSEVEDKCKFAKEVEKG